MLIAGLDLAAEPKGSALAVIDFSASKGQLVSLQVDVDDADVLATSSSVTKLGIDCALGWPMAFTQFVQRHALADASLGMFDGDLELRRKLAYRETDRAVKEVTGRWPLSVSTDRLGMTAIRCAGLLSKLGSEGHNVNRAGTGLVVEVYPAASMKLWKLDSNGYRKSPDARRALLAEIHRAAPWLETASFAELMIESCDAFDAVVAALAARSAALGLATTAPPHQRDRAEVEGWLHLPTGTLAELA
jgi:predicted nuclease with RNAse H fold